MGGLLRFSALVIVASEAALGADLTLTMGGDINFNSNRNAPRSEGFGGATWDELTSELAPLIDGDLNFANIETVVTDQRLPAQSKTFVFASHPDGVRHLIGLGFNLFSLANNHAYDHGFAGIDETVRHMKHLQGEFPGVHAAGLGTLDEVRSPTFFDAKGYRVAFAAVGIMDGSFRARPDQAGMLDHYSATEWETLLKAFRESRAQLKILSIHYGTEGRVNLDAGQRTRYEKALVDGDLDLIIGHHPHVARPVGRVGRGLIFYSLGNYLMMGAANIDGRGVPKDFGLFAKLSYTYDASIERLVATRADLLPLKSMNRRTRPIGDVAESQRRLRALEALGQSDLGDSALSFAYAEDNPWGVWRADELKLH